ncbi:MAG: recombinase family protein [Candidatus Thorarchaeota archaeon]|jgi:site-specific DNA recombinase
MEVALYARVSTTRQQLDLTIEQQIERLRGHVEEQPEWHLEEKHIYLDEGYSGAKLNRPGLDRLREHIPKAEFEMILITAPDRLARNYVHQTLLIEEFQNLGCQVQFVERPMSQDPHDQLLLQIRGAVAEYERSLITERMRRGRRAKLRSGLLLPWTVAPYGYLPDPDNPRDASKVNLDPVKSELVRQMFAWYTDPQKRCSLYWIAKKLSDDGIPTPRGGVRWNVATIRGILRSPTYAGMAYSGRTRPAPAIGRRSALQPVGTREQASVAPAPQEDWIGIPVPAIVSQKLYDVAQQRLDENKQMSRRNNHKHGYLLRALVSCGQCRLSSAGRMVHPGYSYYVCGGRTDTLRAAQGERCTARYVPSQALDTLVWEDLCGIITSPELITQALERAQAGEWLPQVLQSRKETLSQSLRQLERQQERLLEVYLGEVIGREELERKRKELSDTQNALQRQLRQLEAQVQKQLDVVKLAAGICDLCGRIQPTLDTLTFEQRRQLVTLLIDRVIVDDEKVEIRYVIPTSPQGEEKPFCHLRKDYLDTES